MFFVLVVSVRVSSEYVSIGLTAVLYFEVVYISILTQGTSYTKLLPLLSVNLLLQTIALIITATDLNRSHLNGKLARYLNTHLDFCKTMCNIKYVNLKPLLTDSGLD